MRIHAISVVKNEADIIQHTLKKALDWADFIYVFDNGSEDETWARVQELASDRIIPWKRDDKPFRECLRGEVFNRFRERAARGDWWCRLDGDEFYDVQCPRRFLAAVPPSTHVVWAIYIDFFITQADLEKIDFSLPPEDVLQELRYYRANYSEPRFFRHRKRLVWPPDGSWPLHMGLVNKERILFRHYKYRSPTQIQMRLGTRIKSRDMGYPGWDPATQLNWQADSASLHYDKKDGQFEIDWDSLPNHVDPLKKRLIKKIMHSLGLWP